MTSPLFDLEVAQRNRTLFLLDAKISAARAELARLDGAAENTERRRLSRHEARLVHANERLVLSALDARADAQAVRDDLGALAKVGQRDALTDIPGAIAPVDEPPSTARWHHARLADLREANEHLVLAVVSAQSLQSKAEDIHQRQVMFLAMVAHELRNPLNPIRMATELLQHAQANEGLLGQVQGILRRQVNHLARLVDDLLDGARASAGKFRLECARVALRDILEPVVDAIRPAVAQRQQTIALCLPSEPVMVHADPLRLAQVFSNLLDNASKYTQRGGEISVDLACLDGIATLRIGDNGIGISAEALPQIFDLFVQEPHARAHDRQGLGLGLAIVRELVEAHGGTIVAASPGRGLGSEFVVTLPVLPDA
jgi:signal transduction histidine kinase